jgi:hypothetical protein
MARHYRLALLIVATLLDASSTPQAVFGFSRTTRASTVPPVVSVSSQPAVTRLFPAERGRIRVDGSVFRDENGNIWDWRGATMFMLPARFRHGEDITPQIRWMQKHGVNVARVFIAGTQGGAEFTDYLRSWEDPNFEIWLGAFFDRMAAEGLRVEATVFTGDDLDAATAQRVLQRTYNLASTRWNVFVEWFNEPWVGRRRALLDTLVTMGVDRKGVLSAYGIQPQREGEGYKPCPVLDYVTPHLPRDLEDFPRNPKDLMAIHNAVRVPAVNDEPLGVIDPARYRDWCDRGHDMWSNCASGGAARTTNRTALVSHFGICRLFGAGCTVHTQAGLEGRAPGADEPLTESLIAAISEVWQFIPADAPSGQYSAPHLGRFPLVWAGGDSLINHAYARILGDRAFVVNPMPRLGWVAKGADGWTMDGVMVHSPFIVRLRRP